MKEVVNFCTRNLNRLRMRLKMLVNSSIRKVSLSSVEGMNRRGRPLGRWKDRVNEYVTERGVRGNGFEWARRECMDRERWRFVCRVHPPGGCWRERGVRAID